MEKRIAERHRVKNPDLIQLSIGLDGRQIPAQVSNISFSGMMLLFKADAFENEAHFAENLAPDEMVRGIIRMDTAQTRFTFQGQVKWTSPLDDDTGYRYSLGIQFDKNSQISSSFMALAISDFQKRKSHSN